MRSVSGAVSLSGRLYDCTDTDGVIAVALLERNGNLAELDRRLEAAAAGRGGVVLVGGEEGIGKSALVGEWTEHIARRARVLVGACDALTTLRPLGPLLDIAATAGGDLAARVQSGAGRDLLFAACLAELTSSATRPAVALIEDAHWADEATLDLIRYLGRRLGSSRALLLLTYRDDEVGPRHPLRVVLGDLSSTARPFRIRLTPLSVDAVRELAAGEPVDPVELHRQTGGNPFFATEILAAQGVGLPPTVTDAVLTRSARLPSGAAHVLEAAAVLGTVVDANEDAIEACVAGGMLRVVEGRLAFRHELARRAILDGAMPSRLADVHRRALAVLRAIPEGRQDVARLAHHADGAGDADAVLAYATAVARGASAVGAHREAVAQCDRALRFCEPSERERRAQLLRAYADACNAAGRIGDALLARRDLLEFARRDGDVDQQAVHLARIAGMLVIDGRNSEAEEAIGAALRLLDGVPPEKRTSFREPSMPTSAC